MRPTRTRTIWLLAAGLCWLCAVAPALGQSAAPTGLPSWFPAEALDGAAAQLATGMAHLAGPDGQDLSDPGRRLVAARRGVRHIANVVDGWGLRGLVVRTPSFGELDLPEVGDPLVATIARYGLCSLGLYPELARDEGERFYVALGEVTVGVISAFLRHEYLKKGGSDEELSRLLADEGWDSLARQLARDEAKRGHVNERCAPVISAMVEGARRGRADEDG